MININLSGKVVTIKGHAGFAEHGSDIVCASVSSIIYTTVNAMFSFDKSSVAFEDNKNMIITILKETDINNKLLNNMIDLLKELEIKYPKNIKISKGE